MRTLSGRHMKKTDDTRGLSLVRSTCNPGRIVAAVVWVAPLTIPSASPHIVIICNTALASGAQCLAVLLGAAARHFALKVPLIPMDC